MSCRSDVERVLAAVLLVAAAGPAMAHGEQVLLMPVGNIVALVAVVVVALVVKIDWTSRVLAVIVAIVVGLPFYFVTNQYLPVWVSYSAVGWFVVGLVPPLAASGVFLLWRRRTMPRKAP